MESNEGQQSTRPSFDDSVQDSVQQGPLDSTPDVYRHAFQKLARAIMRLLNRVPAARAQQREWMTVTVQALSRGHLDIARAEDIGRQMLLWAEELCETLTKIVTTEQDVLRATQTIGQTEDIAADLDMLIRLDRERLEEAKSIRWDVLQSICHLNHARYAAELERRLSVQQEISRVPAQLVPSFKIDLSSAGDHTSHQILTSNLLIFTSLAPSHTFWTMVYIGADELPKLKEYKYSGVDHSLLSRYVLKPFYTNVAIRFFPLSMAPNAITLTGFAFVIINLLTLFYYDTSLDRDCPSWVYISWAIGLFFYQTCDALDGTQARRTKQSGPLGELFDHGVDALNTTLEVLLFAAAMNLGQGWKTILTLFASLLTFYIQTWDEYHTHILTLGIVSGPVEGIMTLIIVYALTAFLGGAHFWQQSLFRSIGFTERPGMIPEFIYELPWNEWYMVYGGIVLVFNTISSCLNVRSHLRERKEPFVPALLGLIPFFVVWTFVSLTLYLHPYILTQHLIPFVLYVGMINAMCVGRIILAHLLKQDFPWNLDSGLTLPMVLAVVDGLGAKFGFWEAILASSAEELTFTYFCVGLGTGIYASFVADVIFTICQYLDIWCLTIKHPYKGDADGVMKKQS